jgi:hypothetical protein
MPVGRIKKSPGGWEDWMMPPGLDVARHRTPSLVHPCNTESFLTAIIGDEIIVANRFDFFNMTLYNAGN